MTERGVEEKKAAKWAKAIAGVFGSTKKDDEENVETGLEIEQLVHVSPEEQQNVTQLADCLVQEQREPTKEELELLRKNQMAADIALFGRMLASNPKFNVEAAAQVAHAVTVNRTVVEDDYFTAVDDLNNREKDAGSAHIGETGFGSGVFYSYVCINRSLLTANLGDDLLAGRAIRALTEAAAQVAPSGKQNSYASRARAIYILAEKGSQQPRQLSAAFLKPVDDEDMATAAIDRLQNLRENMDKIYGQCADAKCCVNVITPGEDTFADLLHFVAG